MDMKYFLQNFIEQKMTQINETETEDLDENQRSLDAHKFKQAAKVKAGIPLRKPGESLAAYVTRKAKAEAKMKKEEVDLVEVKQPYVVIDTNDNNTVVAMASDEKGASRSIATAHLPPMQMQDKSGLKVVKTRRKQSIGSPLKESTELTEDIHNDLNDAIIEFQKKLMRMTRQLDPAIAKEVKRIDSDLDALRTGPLFKIRPGS